jgi:threonine synthase
MKESKFIYECVDCVYQFHSDGIEYLCPKCGKLSENLPPRGILKLIYDFDSLKRKFSGFNDFKSAENLHFIDFLPIKMELSLPQLRVGATPLYMYKDLAGNHLYLKDDSQNPTFSFKDRASALVSAFAKEKGISTIVAASTGNAGSSLAGICASQGQRAIIFVPAAAPKAKLCQIVMYGAHLVPIAGTYDEAFDICTEISRELGLYNRNTAYNPLTIEGKKIVSFEIFIQTKGKIPQKIFVPVGDGVIISGVYKGFEDLLNVGLIEKMPEIIGVQSEKSRNIEANYLTNDFKIHPATTIADSISVDIPRNYSMAKGFLNRYNGQCITVTDDEIIAASKQLSSRYGLFAEPASTAAFAGYLKEANETENGSFLVLLTGSGLKDIRPLLNNLEIPEEIAPDKYAIKQYFNNLDF